MGEKHLVFVGSLNREAPYFQGARGVGLSVYSFDDDSLETELLTETNSIDNPTYLSVNADGSRIYANSEVFNWREGLVTALSYDRRTATISHINMQPSLGSITAHNMISHDGSKLLVSNYAMGDGGPDQSLVVFGIREDGGLTSALSCVAHTGKGTHPERQERSHAHSLTELTQGGVAIACDLGLDLLIAYRLEVDGTLAYLNETAMPAGSGPRHLALHPDGTMAVVINELNSTVSSLRIDPGSGSIDILDTKPAFPEHHHAESHCADIHLSSDGRYVYGSNRGHDSIVIYALDQNSGQMDIVDHVPCGGATPRNMALTPCGRFLFSANQNADRVSIFRRDEMDGTLSDTGHALEIGTPMCVKFALENAD